MTLLDDAVFGWYISSVLKNKTDKWVKLSVVFRKLELLKRNSEKKGKKAYVITARGFSDVMGNYELE